ncbi:uncharacterized protein isoform X2 [Leptinotarsa decemlineata]|uniref:uncharacterized protein isoform X2 n=1 Tax=Leptinotarsa decemlineata TaxID=7539 RepID=UPI003D30A161
MKGTVHLQYNEISSLFIEWHCVKRTLPFKCAVRSCPNFFLSYEERNKYPFKFHNFPTDKALREVWKEKCGWKENSNITCRLKVCSDHFELNDYIRNYKEEFSNPNFKRQLKRNAIPTKNINKEYFEDDVVEAFCSIPCSHVNHDTEDYLDTQLNSGVVLKKNMKIIQSDKESLEKTCCIKTMQSSYSNECIKEPGFLEEVKMAVDHNEILNKNMSELLLIEKEIKQKLKKCERKIKFVNKKLRSGKIDKDIIHKVFSDAQINVLQGKKKVYWSNDDLAEAFILRQIGTKQCYLYLKNTLNIPLPSLSCIQRWAASSHVS